MTCFRCDRKRLLEQRRAAVLAELKGGEPAQHLGPLHEPDITLTRRERHAADSASFRRTGETC